MLTRREWSEHDLVLERMQIQPRRPPVGFGLLQPTPPLPNGGGSSNGLEDREPSCESRQGVSPPVRAARKGARTKKPQTMCGDCGFRRRGFNGLPNPITLFCETARSIERVSRNLCALFSYLRLQYASSQPPFQLCRQSLV